MGQIAIEDKYVNQGMSKILRHILEGKISKISPDLDNATNGRKLGYKELNGSDAEEQAELVSFLKEKGIATEELSGTAVQCSYCNYFKFRCSHVCTFCKSTNIVKGQVIRHFTCNNVDFDYKFLTTNAKLRCEKCSTDLKAIGVDYSKQSNFFKCTNCNSLGPSFDLEYTCEGCGKISSEDELEILPLLSYNIDLTKLAIFAQETDYLVAVVEELRGIGINAISGAQTRGRSGVTHHFDIMVYSRNMPPGNVGLQTEGNPVIVADIIHPRIREHNHLRASFMASIAKFVDVQAKNKLLIAVTSLNDDEKILASTYGITVSGSENVLQAGKSLILMISDIMEKIEKGEAAEPVRRLDHILELDHEK